LCVRSCLKSVWGFKFLILFAYHLDTMFTSARMWESVVIFRSQKGFASKKRASWETQT
jgi:hypothetical protein